MKYWLHRIAYCEHVSYPLLDKGFLSIGFSDFANSHFLKEASSENPEFFDNQFKEKWGHLSRKRHYLSRFLAEMNKGDRVIVPSWGTFSIYEVMEENATLISSQDLKDLKDWSNSPIHSGENGLLCDSENNVIDLGFLRAVQPIKTGIPRHGYADAKLTSRMKIRMTNADISDLADSIKKALEAWEKKKPIDLKGEIYAATQKIWLEKIRSELNPNKFEKLVSHYFEKIGASEVSIPPKNEANKVGDADVIATFDALRTVINIQVKHHTGETSGWAIEQITDFSKSRIGMDDGYQSQYWVISSGDTFSDESYELAIKNEIQLIDGIQFAKMLIDSGIGNLSDL